MSRDELVEAGAHAIAAQHQPVANSDERLRRDVGIVVDAVEPLIRADERERVNVSWQTDFDNEMADLHAKVEALPEVVGGRWFMRPAVYRHDVLALFDGGSDA